jgi:Zn-dependent metalloprotease
MENIPHLCGFIPRHVFEHVVAHDTGRAAADARATLDQMHLVAEDRVRSLIPPVPGIPTHRKARNVYDAGHRRSLPGKLAINDRGRTSSDRDANEAYDGAGRTYDFFAEFFGRDSIDGRGLRIDSTVHYGVRFANAMWNGRQIIYGDGDGRLFGRFTPAIDVVAHELTHAYTQYTAGLVYEDESGALNEHVSDAFGVMVKQFQTDQTAEQSNWLIGEGVLAPSVNGRAIRSMAAPGTAYDDPILGKDPQPWHMRDYVHGADDNGGIHINSGIPNHALYLAAIAIKGRTWPVLGRIWFETLTKHLAPETTFQQFANATTRVAGALFGFGGTIQTCVATAWAAVGLPTPPEVQAPPLVGAPPVEESIGGGVHPVAATASHPA